MKSVVLYLFAGLVAFQANAEDSWRYSPIAENQKVALLDSLTNRNREVESRCTNYSLRRNKESGQINEMVSTHTTVSTIQVVVEDDKITQIIQRRDKDPKGSSRVPMLQNITIVTEFVDENTVKTTSTWNSFSKNHEDGSLREQSGNWLRVERYENGRVVEVKLNARSGNDPGSWPKRSETLLDPFGVEKIITWEEERPELFNDEHTEYLESRGVCVVKEVGVDSYRDLLEEYVMDTWSVEDRYELSFYDDGTFYSYLKEGAPEGEKGFPDFLSEALGSEGRYVLNPQTEEIILFDFSANEIGRASIEAESFSKLDFDLRVRSGQFFHGLVLTRGELDNSTQSTVE